MSKKTEVIYFRESALQSIIADIASFGILGSLVVCNVLFLGQRWYFDVFAILLFFSHIQLRRDKKAKVFTNYTQLYCYIETQKVREKLEQSRKKIQSDTDLSSCCTSPLTELCNGIGRCGKCGDNTNVMENE